MRICGRLFVVLFLVQFGKYSYFKSKQMQQV